MIIFSAGFCWRKSKFKQPKRERELHKKNFSLVYFIMLVCCLPFRLLKTVFIIIFSLYLFVCEKHTKRGWKKTLNRKFIACEDGAMGAKGFECYVWSCKRVLFMNETILFHWMTVLQWICWDKVEFENFIKRFVMRIPYRIKFLTHCENRIQISLVTFYAFSRSISSIFESPARSLNH